MGCMNLVTVILRYTRVPVTLSLKDFWDPRRRPVTVVYAEHSWQAINLGRHGEPMDRYSSYIAITH